MDLDTVRHLARNTYRKEYVAKTPISWREKFFLYPAAGLLKGGLCIAGGALCALMFGATVAAPILAASLLAVAVALPMLHMGSTLHDRRAELALERDIDNGILLTQFRQQMAPQPVAEPGMSKLIVLSAKESFNKPEAAPVQIPMPSVPMPVLRPAAA